MLVLLGAVGGMLFISQRNQRGSATLPDDGHAFVADIDNWRRTERERAVTSPYDFNLAGDLTRLPLQLGDWAGVDVPQTNLEVAILLEPEQYVFRLYRRPDGRSLWLSIIGSRKSKSFHSPQICYDTSGWQTEASSEAIPLARGEFYALRLVAGKTFGESGWAEHLVLYFYLWPTYARDQQEGTVLVKVTAPVETDVAESLADAKAFLGLLFTSAVE